MSYFSREYVTRGLGDWMVVSVENRHDMDKTRTLAHNTFIDACNILSRNMGKQGEGNAWRRDLRDNRKDIGDFACYLHCNLGIRAR